MPVDATRRRIAYRGAASTPIPAPRPERAQRVWRRARELADLLANHDRFELALELLRVAHHDPATMAHAVTLGRTHLRAHPDDHVAGRGVRILEAAITFLGVKPRPGDVAAPGRR